MAWIAYRKVLPVAQLATYMLLIWYGCPYRPTWERWATRAPAVQGGWDPAWIDGPLPFLEQLASGINFPASFAQLLLIPFDSVLHTGASRELASHVVVALCVPVLWYAVGRRLDRGTSSTRQNHLPAARALTIAGLAVLSLGALTALLSFALQPEQSLQVLVLRGLALLWMAGLAAALYARLRHWNLPVNTM